MKLSVRLSSFLCRLASLDNLHARSLKTAHATAIASNRTFEEVVENRSLSSKLRCDKNWNTAIISAICLLLFWPSSASIANAQTEAQFGEMGYERADYLAQKRPDIGRLMNLHILMSKKTQMPLVRMRKVLLRIEGNNIWTEAANALVRSLTYLTALNIEEVTEKASLNIYIGDDAFPNGQLNRNVLEKFGLNETWIFDYLTRAKLRSTKKCFFIAHPSQNFQDVLASYAIIDSSSNELRDILEIRECLHDAVLNSFGFIRNKARSNRQTKEFLESLNLVISLINCRGTVERKLLESAAAKVALEACLEANL